MTPENRKIVQRIRASIPPSILETAKHSQEDFDFVLLIAWQDGGLDALANYIPRRLREIGDER